MTATLRPAMHLVAAGLAFPEGPVALAGGALLVTEIARGTITRVEADGSARVVAQTGGGPNGAAIGPDGALYVCNNGGLAFADEDGLWAPKGLAPDHQGGALQVVDLSSGQVDTVLASCDGTPLGAPNDLVFDAAGRCWFTDVLRGAVMVLDVAAGEARTALDGLRLPNGIGLSPDGNRLYVAETHTGNLLTAPVAGGPPDVLWSSGGAHGLDSLAVDTAGNVCVASLGSPSGVTVVNPDGRAVAVVAVPEPDEYVTNICFGDGGRTAYITSSGRGRVYSLDWDGAGLLAG